MKSFFASSEIELSSRGMMIYVVSAMLLNDSGLFIC